VLGGELVDPAEALALGALDEICDHAEVLPRAIELAERRARLPREAYERIKRQLRGETIDLARAAADDARDPVGEGWLGEEAARASAEVLGR
jgi:enoyl-CoA hydratase/carnithine racemase